MHPVSWSDNLLHGLAPADWWASTCPELERMAAALVGTMPGGWVRRGQNFIEICGEYGADARFLDKELAALAEATRRIRQSNSPDAALRAATFFHLRFQRIHPLVEANGRVGRVILAMQLSQAYPISPSEILAGLKDWEVDYRNVFVSRDSATRFELLLDLLARILGIIVSPESSALPASLDPLHPQKSIPKSAGPRVAPESFIKK
jgi:hypothetical protein